jgi:thioredoxin reductase
MRSVVIVGGGPAGLTAARVLHAAGLRDVLVLERSEHAGGLPRSCGHPGFGLLDLGRMLTGPAYARRLVEKAQGVEIATGATVLGLAPGGVLTVSTASGVQRIESRVVLLATGIRETPRSARLVSGTRPWGVTTTGALQDMVYLGAMRPFTRPVIVGTELVSFSALLTCRHAGIRPVAMLEEGKRITARRPADLLARAAFGVPVLTATRLCEIIGTERVEGVVVECAGCMKAIACDGVVFTGRFTPEATLVRASHLTVDLLTGGPSIDTFWRCTDPRFFAAGNMIRPVEHSGAAAAEGRRAAEAILRALDGGLPDPAEAVPVAAAGALRYVYPQRVIPTGQDITLLARAARAHNGWFRLLADDQEVARRRVSALSERRLTLRVPATRLRGYTSLVATLD